MDSTVGKNIYMLRKKYGLTQEELAKRINVSFQAISKWETGNSTPDLSILPLLANIFHCNIDSLLGYPAEQQKIMDYEERYKAAGYYWGNQPSTMCYEVMKLCPPNKPLRLLDIACGEGKNAVFFARNGYNVTAFDAVALGLDKAKRFADQVGVEVNFFRQTCSIFGSIMNSILSSVREPCTIYPRRLEAKFWKIIRPTLPWEGFMR